MKHICDWMKGNKLAKNDFNAAAIVNGLRLWELPDDEEKKKRVLLYRDWRNAGERPATAFEKAIKGEPVLPKDTEPMFDGALLGENDA